MAKRVRRNLSRRRSTKRLKRKGRISKRVNKRVSKNLSKRIRNRKVRRGGKPILGLLRSCLDGSCTEVSSSSSKRPQSSVSPSQFNAPPQEVQERLQRHFKAIEQQEQARLATLTKQQREREEMDDMIESSKYYDRLYEDRQRRHLTLETSFAPQQLGATLHGLFPDFYINDPIKSINLNTLLRNKPIGYLESLFKDISVIPFGGSQGSVEALYVSENELIELPDRIGHIKSLKTLDISRNNISYLPVTMQKLTALQSLNLSSSGILEVPQWITQFKLEELFLDNLFLEDKTLPDLGRISSLRTLSLGYNDLQQFPDWIRNLTKLTRLQVNNNYISKIPEWIGNIKQLTHIDLSQNMLSTEEFSLPMSLTNLRNLTTLVIFGNPLIKSRDSVIEELRKNRGLTIVNVLEYAY